MNGTTRIVTGNFISVDGGNAVNPTFLAFQPSAVPERSTFVFGALGLVALALLKRLSHTLPKVEF